jgi:hypothetical protein
MGFGRESSLGVVALFVEVGSWVRVWFVSWPVDYIDGTNRPSDSVSNRYLDHE